MGWTETHKPVGVSVDTFFDDFWKGTGIKWLSKGYLVNMSEYYRPAINKDGEAFAVVMLIRFSRDSYFNFGYKDMDDTMGPFCYQAPKEMLDLLDKYPEPKSEEARKWRQLCREHIAKMKSLREGTVIRFSRPLSFTSGFTEDTFRLYKSGSRRKGLRLQAVSNGAPVIISRWKNRDFEIVG